MMTDDLLLPPHTKMAYLKSQQLQLNLNSTSKSNKLNSKKSTSTPTSTYINDKEFRLRFLRHEFFDIAKAAIRMVTWLDIVVELFGLYALERPIRLSDFPRSESKYFHLGR